MKAIKGAGAPRHKTPILADDWATFRIAFKNYLQANVPEAMAVLNAGTSAADTNHIFVPVEMEATSAKLHTEMFGSDIFDSPADGKRRRGIAGICARTFGCGCLF
ncbi:hypothetical protein NFJ02_33g82680 [Pycnococcus provasolii]